MIKVIGKENCSACEMTKTILKNRGIDFEYKLLNDLDGDLKKEYMQLAREQGKLSMPLIVKNEQLITLQEVIA